MTRPVRPLALAAVALVAAAAPLFAQGKKYALLVGVSQYEHPKIRALKYTENDVTELASVLGGKGGGYEVVVLRNGGVKPTAENIRAALGKLLAKVKRDDLVLVGLAGHGMQLAVHDPDGRGKPKEYPFFFPLDAGVKHDIDYRTGACKNLINLNSDLLAPLGDCKAGNILVLIDACREEQAVARSFASAESLVPERVSALFSCTRGQFAHETDKLGKGHGVFFHFVIEGLKGKARNSRGEVIWTRLHEYVREQVTEYVPANIGGGAKQTPHEYRNGIDNPVLLSRRVEEPTPAETADTLYREGLEHFFGKAGPVDEEKAAGLFEKAAGLGDPRAAAARAVILFQGLSVERDPRKAGDLVRKHLKALEAAAAKDRTAANWLGLLYYEGIGMERDDRRGVEWFEKAADLGDADAMDNLGMAYFEGRGVGRDVVEAYRWYKLAAERGLPRAMLHLGEGYRTGAGGLREDVMEAYLCFKDAADRGFPPALTVMGRARFFGWGVPKSTRETVAWYEKAVRKKDADGMLSLGHALLQGEIARRDIDRGMKLIREAADKGHVRAMTELGDILILGRYEQEKDAAAAMKLYARAVDREDSVAMRSLAYAAEHGLADGKPDLAEARRWNVRAAKKGDADAMFAPGNLYLEGKGVEADAKAAFAWYKQAAAEGHPLGLTAAGALAMYGKGTAEDLPQVRKWLLEAEKKGSADAMYLLGVMSEEGKGAEKSREEALKWYRKAGREGHKQAKEKVKELEGALRADSRRV